MKIRRGLFFILIFLLFGISFINAAVSHTANGILIKVDGTDRTLDAGADYFRLTHTYALSPSVIPGHNANEIWVSVKDGEMTLLQALQSPDKLCPYTPIKTSYTSSNIPDPSHLATEIILASGKNLQQAIDDNTFCYTYSWYISPTWGTCDPCKKIQTRTVYCKRDDGRSVADSFCIPPKPETSQSCTTSSICTGVGCSSCPWGSTKYSNMYYCNLNGKQGRYKGVNGWNGWRYSPPADAAACDSNGRCYGSCEWQMKD